jgi:hypothetical protein
MKAVQCLLPVMLVFILLLSASGAQAAHAGTLAATDIGDPSRQMLVLLHLPPPHYRAGGDSSGAYDDGLGRSGRLRIATHLAKAHGLTLVTDWPMPLLGVDCYVLAAPGGRSVEDEAQQLSRDPAVEWSQPMNLYHTQAAAGTKDPLVRAQPGVPRWRLADLQAMATGKNVIVAVVDSQIDATHPDLAGQVRTMRDFAPGRPSAGERHGAGVAGIIAARQGSGKGVVGVAPRTRLMGLRACWQTDATAAGTVCDSLTLAQALHFAIDNNAQVINLSLSGPNDALLGRLIDVARARGITVVGAYDPAAPRGGFPADHAGVVAVSDTLVDPPRPGLYTAPGRDIPTTEPGARWSLANGSSYAAANVSGLIALMRERDSRSSKDHLLVASRSGGGAIDACAPVVPALGPCDCECARTIGLAVESRS